MSSSGPQWRVGDREFTPANPALIVSAVGPGHDQFVSQVRAARCANADVIEVRIDALVGGGPHRQLVQALDCVGAAAHETDGIPLLATVRSSAEGGHGPTGEGYRRLVEALIATDGVDCVDIETDWAFAPALIAAARARGLGVVGSRHDFCATGGPRGLESAFRSQLALGVDAAKVAVMPRREADVAALLLAVARVSASTEQAVIGISMGEIGALSRLVAPQFGSVATFATAGGQTASAPGQLDIDDVRRHLTLVREISAGRPAAAI